MDLKTEHTVKTQNQGISLNFYGFSMAFEGGMLILRGHRFTTWQQPGRCLEDDLLGAPPNPTNHARLITC